MSRSSMRSWQYEYKLFNLATCSSRVETCSIGGNGEMKEYQRFYISEIGKI